MASSIKRPGGMDDKPVFKPESPQTFKNEMGDVARVAGGRIEEYGGNKDPKMRVDRGASKGSGGERHRRW